MTRWVSDDGEIELRLTDEGMVAKLDDEEWTIKRQGVADYWHESFIDHERRQVDTFSVAQVPWSASELFTMHSRGRPGASGTEGDPRSTTREWTCTRVIEGEATT